MSEVSERLAEVAHAKLCRELGACDDPLAYAPIANALAPVVEQMLAEARAEALREFADSRGVNVGDEDSEWWRGYRQAQRECVHDASDAAEREAR